MASLLHQQLKQHYVPDTSRQEVVVGAYRIDAVDRRGRLIEIQCASLSSIRDKIRTLVEDHQVIVVKPLAARKRIVRLLNPDGDVISARYSPVRQSLPHLFLELVHFGIFPHPRLQLDVLLTEQEERRIPPTARSSWRKKYSVEDRALITVLEHVRLKTAADLWRALDMDISGEFTTSDLVEAATVPRWLAQKIAWCFCRMNFIRPCGKQGNSIVYRLGQRTRKSFRKSA